MRAISAAAAEAGKQSAESSFQPRLDDVEAMVDADLPKGTSLAPTSTSSTVSWRRLLRALLAPSGAFTEQDLHRFADKVPTAA